jgi:hypothetical protein
MHRFIIPQRTIDKYTTEATSSASFLDNYHVLTANLISTGNFVWFYDKRDDSNFVILSFPRLGDSNIPNAPVHGTKLYDKIDDCNCWKVNIPFKCCNIHTTPVCVVYISQLIWYCSVYGSFIGFRDRRLLLTRKLLIQGIIEVKIKSSLGNSSWCHHDLFIRYEWWMCSVCPNHFLFSFMTYQLAL